MASFESRPYQVPTQSAAGASVEVITPACALHEVAEHWSPGESVVVRIRVTVKPDFWSSAGIQPSDTTQAVAVATCLSSRSSWRVQMPLVFDADGAWSSVGELELDGSSLAVEASVNVWIVGDAQIAVPGHHAVHRAAKLWQMPESTLIPLEDVSLGFPTTATSFRGTGRRGTLWSVESPSYAEPSWSISSAVRVYVNTDNPRALDLLEGRASDDAYAALQSDIHVVTLQRLAGCGTTTEQLQRLASERADTLAALGATFAATMGLSLGESLRLASEDYSQLIARSREALSR